MFYCRLVDLQRIMVFNPKLLMQLIQLLCGSCPSQIICIHHMYVLEIINMLSTNGLVR